MGEFASPCFIFLVPFDFELQLDVPVLTVVAADGKELHIAPLVATSHDFVVIDPELMSRMGGFLKGFSLLDLGNLDLSTEVRIVPIQKDVLGLGMKGQRHKSVFRQVLARDERLDGLGNDLNPGIVHGWNVHQGGCGILL